MRLKIWFWAFFFCFGFAVQGSGKQTAVWHNSRKSREPLAVVSLHSHFSSCSSGSTWLRISQSGHSPEGAKMLKAELVPLLGNISTQSFCCCRSSFLHRDLSMRQAASWRAWEIDNRLIDHRFLGPFSTESMFLDKAVWHLQVSKRSWRTCQQLPMRVLAA